MYGNRTELKIEKGHPPAILRNMINFDKISDVEARWTGRLLKFCNEIPGVLQGLYRSVQDNFREFFWRNSSPLDDNNGIFI